MSFSSLLTIQSFAVQAAAINGVTQIKNQNTELNICPNPANSFANVAVNKGQLAEIKLLDILGKEVLSTKEKDVDVSTLQEGVYFVQVKTEQGVLTKKIIVQR